MIIRHRVHPSLPEPARTAVNIIQAALKVDKKTASRLIHDGFLKCEGRTISQSHWRFEIGQVLEIDYAPQPKKNAGGKKKGKAPTARFEIVHDDESLIVVNKPAGLLTVPSPQRDKNTLRSQIAKWLTQRQPGKQAICVHRLDRGVSGLLVFAKSEEVAEKLRQQFSARKPERLYSAFVCGSLADDQGTFRSHLATQPQSLNRYSVAEGEEGELAITHYRVQQRLDGITQVAVRLETGRRNQIRVHFAEQGHPIVGDQRYRTDLSQHTHWQLKRMALHAETLGFSHPETNDSLMFQAPWPQEFRSFLRRVRPSGKKHASRSRRSD